METKAKRTTRDAGPVEFPAKAPGALATPAEPAVIAAAQGSYPVPLASPSAAAEADTLAAPAAATPGFAVGDPTPAILPTAPPPAESPARASGPAGDLVDFGCQALVALTESQAALVKGLEAINLEVAGLARSEIDRAARAAADMLSVKTISDAIGVNAVFARSSFESLISGSAKLSELGIRLAADSAQPILTRFGKTWIAAAAAYSR